MHAPSASHRPSRGFTLLEVMIVVAIIGILSMVAYPSYRDYILRGNLVDGTSGLTTVRADLERHFQDNRSYATVGTFTSPCLSSQTFGTFTVSCASSGAGAPDGTTYTLRAVGSGATAGFEYRVNQSNVQSTQAVGSNSGFSTCATAWIMKRGQPCT